MSDENEQEPESPLPAARTPRSRAQWLWRNAKHPLTVAVVGAVVTGSFSVYAAQAGSSTTAPSTAAPTTSREQLSPSSTVPTSSTPTTSKPDGSNGLEAPAPSPTQTLPPVTTPQSPPTADPWAAWCDLYVGIGRKTGVIVDGVLLTWGHAGEDAYLAYDEEVVSHREELLNVVPSSIFGDMQLVIEWFARYLQDRTPGTVAEINAHDNLEVALRDHCGIVIE